MASYATDNDVIVIGAGHNGLVAANYLADAGLSTVVLEADSQIGGMTSCAYTIPAAPDHLVNRCAVDPLYWDVFPPARELNLHNYGLRTIANDPPLAYLDPDGSSIAFFNDPRRTAEDIARFSRADAVAWLEFVRTLDAFGALAIPLLSTNPVRPELSVVAKVAYNALRHARQLPDAGFIGVATANEIVQERFEHPTVKAALLANSGQVTNNQLPTSGLAFIQLAMLHRGPMTLRPVGGVQAICNALARRLQSKGGTIRLDSPVAEIPVRGNRATGVILEDGTEIHAAKAVLATCSPLITLQEFLPSDTLPPKIEKRVRALPSRQGGYGVMKVDVACSGQLQLSRHNKMRPDGLDLRRPAHFIATPEGIERSYHRAAAGLLPYPQDTVFWSCITTALDPSQAPDGQDTLYLYMPGFPVDPEGGWTPDLKAKAGQGAIDYATEFFDGLGDMELGRSVETSRDIEQARRSRNGHVQHVDFVASRMAFMRPARGLGGYATPVDGLFLGGAGSHPSGGITGAPGYNSAKAVIRSLKRLSRH